MANTYKNIIITPNRDSDAANVPFIRFSGGDGTSNTDINVRVYTTQSGTLSFEGNSKQLLTITNDTFGSAFGINDDSNLPFFNVDTSNAKIVLAPYGGNVGIGVSNPQYQLHISGTASVSGSLVSGSLTTSTINSTTITNSGDITTTGRIFQGPREISKMLSAFDAAPSDSFTSLAISDDGGILVVGANGWEGASGTDRGGVYTYEWNGSNWVQKGSILEASDAANGDYFGQSVALANNGIILVVGANYWEGATGSNRGGVYTYDWSGFVWVQRGSILEASDAADGDLFGTSVSLSSDGSMLVVGAPYWEGATGSNRGGVYIYSRSGSSWVQSGTVLESPVPTNSALFGQSVAFSGGILAVGDATGYSAASGTVWLWELYSSGVTRTAKGNVASTGTKSISLSSDGYRFRNSSDSGTTYTYKWNGSSWEQVGSSFSFPYGTVNVSRSAASRNESILVISDGTKRSNLSFLSVGVVYTYTLDGSSPTKSIYSRGLGWTESANSTSTSLYPVASPTLVARTAGLDRITIDLSGNVGIATSTPSSVFDVNSDTIRVRTAKTPASNTATGNQGDICWDANYIYVCTAANTWKRSSISTW